MTTILDVTGWKLINTGDGWRYVSHKDRLATAGWKTYKKAVENANGYRDDAGTRQIMAARYTDLMMKAED